MGRFLFFWILLSIGLVNRAQNLNRAYHSALEYVGDAVSINTNFFYVERNSGGPVFFNGAGAADSACVVGVNNQGERLFKSIFKNDFSNIIISLIPTLDKKLAYFGTSWECDLGPFHSYFVVLDTNGNQVFSTPVDSANNSGPHFTGTLSQAADSTFYIYHDGLVVHLTKSGQYISEQYFAGFGGTMCTLANGNLLVASGNTLKQVNPQYQVLHQTSIPASVKKIKESANGLYYALSSTYSITVYNSSLNVVAMPSPALNTVSITTFNIHGDTLCIAGTSNSLNNVYYAVLNPSLQIVHQCIQNYKRIESVGVVFNSKRETFQLNLCSSSARPDMTFGSFYILPHYACYQSKYDVGLVDFEFYNASVGPIGLNMELVCYVKNFGTDTVYSFNINKYTTQSLCKTFTYNKNCQLVLAPNQTATITSGVFAQTIPPGTIGPSTLNLCLFTTIPNNENDIGLTNDGYCKSIWVPTGLRESEIKSESVSVFPNPFISFFTIQSDFEIREITVFNALGLAVCNQSHKGREVILDLQGFESGIYFVRIETEKGVVTKKLIKQ